MGTDLSLQVYPSKKYVAYYRRQYFSWMNEGYFELFPAVHHMQDLVIATGFAMEERERENV